jgi:hypothetical protein
MRSTAPIGPSIHPPPQRPSSLISTPPALSPLTAVELPKAPLTTSASSLMFQSPSLSSSVALSHSSSATSILPPTFDEQSPAKSLFIPPPPLANANTNANINANTTATGSSPSSSTVLSTSSSSSSSTSSQTIESAHSPLPLNAQKQQSRSLKNLFMKK